MKIHLSENLKNVGSGIISGKGFVVELKDKLWYNFIFIYFLKNYLNLNYFILFFEFIYIYNLN